MVTTPPAWCFVSSTPDFGINQSQVLADAGPSGDEPQKQRKNKRRDLKSREITTINLIYWEWFQKFHQIRQTGNHPRKLASEITKQDQSRENWTICWDATPPEAQPCNPTRGTTHIPSKPQSSDHSFALLRLGGPQEHQVPLPVFTNPFSGFAVLKNQLWTWGAFDTLLEGWYLYVYICIPSCNHPPRSTEEKSPTSATEVAFMSDPTKKMVM